MVEIYEFTPFSRPVKQVKYNMRGDLCFASSSECLLPVFRSGGTFMEILGNYVGHTGEVRYIDVDVSSTKLLTAGSDYYSHVFDVETGKRLWRTDTGGKNTCCGISMDSRKYFIAVSRITESKATQNFLYIYDGLNGPNSEVKYVIDESKNEITCGIWGPFDQYIILGRSNGCLLFWDLNAVGENHKHHQFEAHKDSIRDMCLSPDGMFLITSSLDAQVKFWDLSKRMAVKTYNVGRLVNTASMSPTKPHMALAGGSLAQSITTTDQSQLMIQPRFFNVINGEEFANLPPSIGALNCIRYHPSGDVLVSGSDGGNVRFHKLDKEFYAADKTL